MATQSGNHKRHDLMSLGSSRKRKERDVLDDAHRVLVTTKHEPAPPPVAQQRLPQLKPVGGGNRLLAGYLAHEFLNKGTLFGQPWGAATKPTAPPQLPVLSKPQHQVQKQKQPALPEPKPEKPPTAYAEVSYLLKTDGAHIPGVVNPTQLARWLQM